MIDSEDRLGELLPWVQRAEWIGIDTEADSLHAYPEKLCLLQISIPNRDALIDPLAGLNLVPLWEILKDRELILHGADYDLRMLMRSFRFVPLTIFDTMLAARLLGYTEVGLIHLVARHLGLELEKGPQKMNWAQRPLPERMETYARNDTRYLRPLEEILTRELQEKGRLEWLRETCIRLIAECSQERTQDPETVWRIKGSDRLDRKGLAVLRELWNWREEEAIESNKPPYFVMSHESLAAMASGAASGKSPVELLPANLPSKRKARLAAALGRGLNVPSSEFPKIRRAIGYRLSEAEQSRFDDLKARRDKQAEQLRIDPTLIASRSMLVTLAQNWEQGQSRLMSWQLELLRASAIAQPA